MEYGAMNVGKIHVLRVDPGEDVLLSVNAFLAEQGIRQAVVLGGYGTLASHHLHWVKHNQIPVDCAFGRAEGGIEVLAINGMVVEGKPHIHVTLATPEGAYGGHIEEGCKAYVVCELFFAEVQGVSLSRKKVPVNVPGMGRGEVTRLMFGEE